MSHVFPEFPAPDLGSVLLQENITLHDIKALQLAYRRHCEVTAPQTPNPGPGGSGGRLGQLREARARASLGVPAGDREQTGPAPPPTGQGVGGIFLRSLPSPLVVSLGLERPRCSPYPGRLLGMF